jgi:hypothetical protein
LVIIFHCVTPRERVAPMPDPFRALLERIAYDDRDEVPLGEASQRRVLRGADIPSLVGQNVAGAVLK